MPSPPSSAFDSDDDLDDDLDDFDESENEDVSTTKRLEADFARMFADVESRVEICTKEQLMKRHGTTVKQLNSQCTWLPRKLTSAPTDDTFSRFEPLIELLLEHPECSDFPQWQDQEQKETILHIATRNNHQPLIRFICKRLKNPGESLLGLSRNRLNCLHIAAQRDRPDGALMQLLLELVNNPEADLAGMEGNTPLHLAVDIQACVRGQSKVVSYLLKGCKDAVRLKNTAGESLTPLQYHYRSRQTSDYNESKRKIGDRIEAMLKLNCLRLNLDRDETREILYGGNNADRREFVFDLVGYEEIRADDLTNLASHVSLETVLKSVIIPDLTVHPKEEYQAEKLLAKKPAGVDHAPANALSTQSDEAYERTRAASAAKPQCQAQDQPPAESSLPDLDDSSGCDEPEDTDKIPECPGRIDYCWIFQWLREQGVTRILRVSVQDRRNNPHSDESLIWCLRKMDVEILNWNKFDVCPNTIRKAVPAVRDLTLHCSGNNVVLGSWASSSGLVKLKHLELLNVKILQGLESLPRTAALADKFKRKLLEQRRRWCHSQHKPTPSKEAPTCLDHQIKVKWSIVGNDGKSVKSNADNEDDRKAEVEKQEWLKCMETFADFIRDYRGDMDEDDRPPRIKVALIDDGVDGLNGELSSVIAAGQTFSERTAHEYNSYFKSTRGHGTIMAMLIRKICPNVSLYVAKLNEQRTGRNTTSITTESAIKAINWAVSHGVHVISISWTIAQAADQATRERLVKAINDAVEAHVLIFCSVSDQGPRDTGQYPASCNRDNTFLIGTATISGQAWRWNGANEVDYILPGTDLDVQLSDALFDSRLRSAYESGSSLATALAAGLAALVLDCIALRDPADLKVMRDDAHARMKMALDSISPRVVRPSGSRDDEKYIHVWDTFGKALADKRKSDDVKLGFVVDILMSRVRQAVGTA